MTSTVDVGNRALQSIGTRSTIASLTEKSNEARNIALAIDPCRKELLRKAPWNCAFTTNTLSLICAAPGTPENPSAGTQVWQKGQPAPPWSYEYAYPSDCLRACWISPQFTTGFSSGVPITTAVTGSAPQFWQGPPVRYKIAIDQIGPDGTPVAGGTDTRVILTNQEQAILNYVKDVTNVDVMDDMFIQAWVAFLASRLVMALTGDKGLANLKIQEANSFISDARAGDGNEGLTVNDVTPDWIRIRGINFADDFAWSPNNYDWGGFLPLY